MLKVSSFMKNLNWDQFTYPSSVMPSTNSFLLNSHWVAALNFHAITKTLILAGSRLKSSQNCWIPSIPILFSSCGSIVKIKEKSYTILENTTEMLESYIYYIVLESLFQVHQQTVIVYSMRKIEQQIIIYPASTPIFKV